MRRLPAPSEPFTRDPSRTRHATLLLALVAMLFVLPACGDDSAPASDAANSASTRAADASGARVEDSAPAQHPVATVAVLGDSISAGLHLDESEAFPALLAARLADEGLPVRMINAGVSGDTSAGGLRRIDWVLKQRPHVLVVELGGNDGLRGKPLDEIAANLRGILERARAADVQPLLLGMALPSSYGPSYTAGFQDLYTTLADDLDVAFVPFFMKDVGGRPELNLDDGLHPNAKGHALLADRIFPALRRVVAEVAGVD